MSGVFVRDHARAAALQHRVAVVAPRLVRERAPGTLRDGDDALLTMRVGYRRSALPLATGLGYTRGVMRALGRLREGGFSPDLIHAHVYEVGIAALVAGRRYGIPVILSEHSSHFSLGTLSRAARLRARLVWRGADLVCPVSEDLSRRMHQLGLRGRVEVVPNPIDTDVFRPSPPPTSGPLIALFVGGLDPVKRVDLLLRALASLRRPDIRLELVGDGPSRAPLEQLAGELGLTGEVRFHGYLGREGVAERLRMAHFLVLPSAVETFGVVLGEALAAGRPLLATRTGAIPEIVDERTGILVAPGDEHALARGIEEMAGALAGFDWRELSARATSRYGLESVGRRWDAIYRSLTS